MYHRMNHDQDTNRTGSTEAVLILVVVDAAPEGETGEDGGKVWSADGGRHRRYE